jgi:biotin carboxyl carrier protein
VGFTLREHEVLIDDKLYKVKLETCAVGTPFSVKINEKRVEVKIDSAPNYEAPFTIVIQGKPYKIELKRIDRKTSFPIKINKIPFNVQLKTAERKTTRISTPSVATLAPRPSRKIAEEGEILAPMAGKIVSVKVKKGDHVKLGDILCTLEAMKMENEITATKSGVIEEINISEGIAVNEGDVLMKIK